MDSMFEESVKTERQKLDDTYIEDDSVMMSERIKKPNKYLFGITHQTSCFYAFFTLLKFFNQEKDFLYLVHIFDTHMDKKQEKDKDILLKKCEKILEKYGIKKNYEFLEVENDEYKYKVEILSEAALIKEATMLILGNYQSSKKKNLIIQSDFHKSLKINILVNQLKIPCLVVKKKESIENRENKKSNWLFLIKSSDNISFNALRKMFSLINKKNDTISGLYIKCESIPQRSKKTKNQLEKDFRNIKTTIITQLVSESIVVNKLTNTNVNEDKDNTSTSALPLTIGRQQSMMSGVRDEDKVNVLEKKHSEFKDNNNDNDNNNSNNDDDELDPVKKKFYWFIKKEYDDQFPKENLYFTILKNFENKHAKFDLFYEWLKENTNKIMYDFIVLGFNTNAHVEHESSNRNLLFCNEFFKEKFDINIIIDH